MADEATDRAPADLNAAVIAFGVEAEHVAETEELARFLVAVRDAKRDLSGTERELENALGERLTGKHTTIEGIGVLERHRDRSWRNWSHEDLLRMVLDSDRRPKNGETGEVESDLDVLRHVYGLKGYNASKTALKDRGIDPTEFAEYEDRGYKVVVR